MELNIRTMQESQKQMAEMFAEHVAKVEQQVQELHESVRDTLASQILQDVKDDDRDTVGAQTVPIQFRWRNDTASGNAEDIHRLEYHLGDPTQSGGSAWADSAWVAVTGADGEPCS